jgi:hypothetical protein
MIDIRCMIFIYLFIKIIFSLKEENDITENRVNHHTNVSCGNNNKKANLMLVELLEKYFNENPWYDSTNLDEITKLTGLEEAYIKVKKKLF